MENNKDLNEFYVYAHYCHINNKIFYIGKGNKRRAWRTTQRNKKWKAYVGKYNSWEVKILKRNLSEASAYDWELKYIEFYGLENLTNIVKGQTYSGLKRTYTTGWKHSEETKKKISEGNKGKIVSEESIIKQRETKKKNNKQSNTKESITKCIETKKKNGTLPKTKFDIQTELEIINKYIETKNMSDIAKVYNCSVSNIDSILKRNNIKKYKWNPGLRKFI